MPQDAQKYLDPGAIAGMGAETFDPILNKSAYRKGYLKNVRGTVGKAAKIGIENAALMKGTHGQIMNSSFKDISLNPHMNPVKEFQQYSYPQEIKYTPPKNYKATMSGTGRGMLKLLRQGSQVDNPMGGYLEHGRGKLDYQGQRAGASAAASQNFAPAIAMLIDQILAMGFDKGQGMQDFNASANNDLIAQQENDTSKSIARMWQMDPVKGRSMLDQFQADAQPRPNQYLH